MEKHGFLRLPQTKTRWLDNIIMVINQNGAKYSWLLNLLDEILTLLNHRQHFRRETVRIESIFVLVDHLTLDEYRVGLEGQDNVDRRFKNFDNNGDDKLTKDEFVGDPSAEVQKNPNWLLLGKC